MRRRELLRMGATGSLVAAAGCVRDSEGPAFEEGFEDGLGDWERGAAIGPEVDLREFEWEVGVSDAEAASDERSLRIWNEGDYDDGVTWAVHPVAVEPGRAYEITVAAQLWSESESFNTLRDALMRLGPERPSVEADFPNPGVNTTALGETDAPVRRSGASPGEVVCVTGSLGRTAAGLEAFEAGETDRANELFRFTPRVAAGVALRGSATAMMDSSDGLARSVHQLAAASDCGFELDFDALPVHDAVAEVATDSDDRRDLAAFFGEDFELVFALPESALDAARDATDVPLTVVGKAVEEATEAAVVADGEAVPDRGYTHGRNE